MTISFLSCNTTTKKGTSEKSSKKISENDLVKNVDPSLFLTNETDFIIKTVDCTLSDGTKTQCYQITTMGIPTDHEMGPWCPHTITDTKEKGGLWFDDGKLHNVDGEFLKELATFYHDDRWLLYDENGTIFRTKTEEDCLKLTSAKILDEFKNYCIECLPAYVSNMSKTYLLPITPVKLEKPIALAKPPKGERPEGGHDKGGSPPPPRDSKDPSDQPKRGPAQRGIAFNGVAYDAPAPTQRILGGYTIPPIDRAGGHINLDAGYHYHAATGAGKKHEQHDHHAPMIGYAMDGYGLYAQLNSEGNEATDLDDCRGHYDQTRGYHYHVDAAANNNFINCFSGAIATTNE